jgi:poly-gamma-glutamate capsule biosynthesis protein CapA/YwtB (metallophosphatase superfamily)
MSNTMAIQSDRLTIALTGDSMLSRSISVFAEEPYLHMRDILKSADVVFTNFEANAHPYLDDPHTQRDGGGSYVTTEPRLLADLKWLGVNLVACGSSHADDYGPAGILATMRYLDEAGIAHAGSGRHLAEARAPAYVETAKGRVALVAATSNFRLRAGEQRYDTLGCPGVNGLRHKVVYAVDRQMLEQLREIGRVIGWEAAVERRNFQGDPKSKSSGDTYNFLGKTFRVESSSGESTFANEDDVRENLRQVRNARAFADKVIVSLHCHDLGGPSLRTAKRRSEVEDLADFAIDFGRRAIDAGADIFVVHGPQVPLAVELYHGKPMLHGIGTFIFQIETMKYLPAEAYERYGLDERATPADFIAARYQGDTVGHSGDRAQWEQMFATCEFTGDDLTELRLYPIDLGFQRRRTDRGRPMLADGMVADRVLRRVQQLSSKYGTNIQIRNSVGSLRPSET